MRRLWEGRRARLVVLVGALVVVLALLGSIVHARATTGPRLIGTNLGQEIAPDFRLRDSSGQAYSLSQFRGKVVVLSFLYTQCPDACPLTADLLRNADAAAGHRHDIVYVAVSVDPMRDNAATIAAFSAEHRLGELGDRFHFLMGSLPELSRVWQRYYIRAADAPTPHQDISHVSSVFFINFINKHGRRRLLTHIDALPKEFARNERILASE